MVKVLIVDDEPKFAEPARRVLDRAGCDVHVAHSMEEAREYVKHTRPDAIILDILFRPEPGAEFEALGCEFLEELKSRKRTKLIPVVMFTVLSDDNMEKRCREAGAADYIRKNAGGARILESLKKAGVPLKTKSPRDRSMITGLRDVFRQLLPKEATCDAPHASIRR